MNVSVKETVALTIAILVGLVASPLFYMMVTGDFPGSDMFYGLQEDSDFVVWVLNLRK